jgi:GLPGLI family protein
MKRQLLPFILSFIFCTISAQDTENILIRAYYIAKFKAVKEDTRLRSDEKVLDIGRKKSYFYSRWEERRNELKDSVLARGGNFNDILKATSDIPFPGQFYSLYRNYPKKGVTTYTDQILMSFVYYETTETPQWTLEKRDTTILNHECMFAQCEFRGRKWEAAYATDIPLNEGPWKLIGLPGLILYAKDSSGIFSFTCIGLKNGNGEVIKNPDLRKHTKCTRKEMQKLRQESDENPEDYAKRFGFPSKGWGADGKPLKYKPKTSVFLEN